MIDEVNTHVSDRLGESLTTEEIKDLNAYHSSENKTPRFDKIRHACEILMSEIYENCPACEDRTEAIKTVRLARMWANSAIALEKEKA